MNRVEEINYKHDQLRQLLAARGADGLLLRRTRNIAWFTAGADASIPLDTDYGAYSVLVTPNSRVIVTDTIEETRLQGEEHLNDLGFEFDISPWYAMNPRTTTTMLSDDGDVDGAVRRLRRVLLPAEHARLRVLGQDATAALEEAARATQPGDNEHDMAARIAAAARRRHGIAIVALVGTDERISRYRHPVVADKRLERYGMLIICMRREGLVVSCTRLVHVGPTPQELQDKLQKVATIDARVIAATRPGRTLGQVFDDLTSFYADVGEADQWKLHHQGGLAGYAPREIVATPGDPTVIEAGMMAAWNPSIVGAKSEDTVLITEDGFDIVSQASASWPKIDVSVNGQLIQRPGILEL